MVRLIVIFSRWGVEATNNEYLHKLLQGLHEIFAEMSTDDIKYYLENMSTDRSYDEGFIKCLMSSRYDELFEYRTRWNVVCENLRYMIDNPDKKRSIAGGGIQCIKDHGVIYTIRLFFKKILGRMQA